MGILMSFLIPKRFCIVFQTSLPQSAILEPDYLGRFYIRTDFSERIHFFNHFLWQKASLPESKIHPSSCPDSQMSSGCWHRTPAHSSQLLCRTPLPSFETALGQQYPKSIQFFWCAVAYKRVSICLCSSIFRGNGDCHLLQSLSTDFCSPKKMLSDSPNSMVPLFMVRGTRHHPRDWISG